ncbi:MAG: serine/threonine protein kinase [Gemmataceae bacterium]|nr:serine/threonine protein kinase [Gemmataceae bacterium]
MPAPAEPRPPAAPPTDELTGPYPDRPPVDRLGTPAEADSTRPPDGSVPDPDATTDLSDDPADTLHVGSLGAYRLVGRLGRGGMGEVWAADDPALGRRVAVKVMRPGVAARPGARDRFLREARAAAAVHHDHVVPIYHVGEDAGVPYLVMPLLEGESLHDRLKRGPLPPAEVIRVGREAALGLAAAHDKGLVHRDVKPSNLWLEAPTGRVKVLDFGLAREAVAGDGAFTGGGAGTPAYMAPEQARGDPPRPKADLFSLGAVLYRAATGTPAFDGPTVTSVLLAVTGRTPPSASAVNPAVPPGLSGLIDRLLAKDPAARPASAGAVAVELEALASGGAAPTAVTVADRSVPRRRRGWLVPVAVMVVAAVGVAGWWLSRTPQADATPAAAGTDTLPPANPPGPVAYTGSVDLLVEREDADGTLVAMPLSDTRVMPLRPGDRCRVDAAVSPPAYLYVFWIDEVGQALPLYPWAPLRWGTRPAAEEQVGEKRIKDANGNWFKIGGDAAGMETVLMLARPTRLGATDDEVKRWFAGLRPLPMRGERARAWFENFELLTKDRTRAPVEGDGLPATFGPVELQELLKGRVGPHAAFARAVSFARLGAAKGGE